MSTGPLRALLLDHKALPLTNLYDVYFMKTKGAQRRNPYNLYKFLLSLKTAEVHCINKKKTDLKTDISDPCEPFGCNQCKIINLTALVHYGNPADELTVTLLCRAQGLLGSTRW